DGPRGAQVRRLRPDPYRGVPDGPVGVVDGIRQLLCRRGLRLPVAVDQAAGLGREQFLDVCTEVHTGSGAFLAAAATVLDAPVMCARPMTTSAPPITILAARIQRFLEPSEVKNDPICVRPGMVFPTASAAPDGVRMLFGPPGCAPSLTAAL